MNDLNQQINQYQADMQAMQNQINELTVQLQNSSVALKTINNELATEKKKSAELIER